MNRAIIVGRLTRNPDLRYTPNGVAVANFTVAVNRPFKNQQGENEADFINCVTWRKQAENLANYMKKGSMIGVDGRIQTRSYEGQDGKRVFVTEILAESIQFLESKGSTQQNRGGGYNQDSSYQQYQGQNQYQGQQSQQQAPQQTGNASQQDPFREEGKEINITDDDLPF